MLVKTARTPEELQDVYHIRNEVFVDEQNVPSEEEIDEFDKTATHFIAYDEETPVAAARLRFTEDGYGKLERICVLKSQRGKSIGKKIMQKMEQEIIQQDFHKAKLNAQTHAQNFYQKLGYEVTSGEFMDAGIPHVTMIKKL
ncbi:N-acetyltransferase [Oceanobacillus oncorhynchi subsp. incaldanensis]|uniref:GNAT family N-acetyltransferase n=2 Tax=Oceanobacillus TaxID=182709 RepID=A0ABV9JXA2_9BACI|nr:GNAT family N-acetyltransferase [Oceanobacillus oncorhynchi]UUI38819.1 GNAT family N-acetyltransferase [Oceanobacillus oncorhynchi]GIO20809.1 N-acetyltransferase [Oceanobacillus oncorhynchi subsp. incaldanensis]CEI84527.1 putative N-acetyltransferase YjcF [Oceanobacillus oncorhynchi]